MNNNSNNNNKKKKRKYLILLLLLFLIITFGYSLLTTNLSINGKTLFGKVTWDIHFENINVNSGSVTAIKEAVINTDDQMTISYEVPLSVPGDYYEFTVDVVNDGQVSAKVGSSPDLGLITEEQDVYLNYYVTYADGSEIKVNDELNIGEKVTYKVRIEFEKNLTLSQLPTNGSTLDLIFTVDYIQK